MHEARKMAEKAKRVTEDLSSAKCFSVITGSHGGGVVASQRLLLSPDTDKLLKKKSPGVSEVSTPDMFREQVLRRT